MDCKHNRVESASGRQHCRACLFLLAAAFAYSFSGVSCAPFDVNVGTEDPLKVDLSMEVHVYQHGEPDEEAKEARKTYKEAMTRRRNRMEEIQELKNNRLVGEAHQGILEIRSLPAGDYGDYVKKTVDAENEDRVFLMGHEANEKSVSLAEVRRMQWRHWQRKSFPGEWLQVEAEEPGEYRWVQKQGAAATDSEATDASE